MSGNLSVRTGALWRDLTAATLRSLGVTTAHSNRPAAKMSERVLQAQSDILDVGSWSLKTAADRRLGIGSALDDAELAAIDDGKSYGAAIVRRRGYDPEDAFAVISVRTLARLIQATTKGTDHATAADPA